MRVNKLLGLTLYTLFTVIISTFFLSVIIGYLLNSFNVINGSTNIISSVREMSPNSFASIKNTTQFNVILKKSNLERITITAEDNLVSQIQTNVKNNQLQIELNKLFPYISTVNIKNNFPIDIIVEYKNLDEVVQAGSGYITTYENEILYSEDLNLKVTGTGEINLNVSSSTLHTLLTGAGSIKISGNTNTYSSNSSNSSQINTRHLKVEDALSTR